MSGGTQSYNLGIKYSLSETASISAGYSRTEFDDVSIRGYGPASPVYTDNSANTFGVKLQVNF
jgi:long-subunit fatty acid transport protein